VPGGEGGAGVRPGQIARWILLTAVLWFLGGGVGLVIAVAIATYVALGGGTPRRLLAAATILLAIVPVEMILRGLPTPAEVSSQVVGGNLLAHYVAGTALVLLVMGILRDVGLAPRDHSLQAGVGAPVVARRRVLIGPHAAFATAITGVSVIGAVLRFAASSGAVADPVAARIASQLVGGRGYTTVGSLGVSMPTGMRMPLVPFLLSATRLAGLGPTAPRLLWAVIGGATAGIAGWAARRMLGVAAGIATCVLVALLPSFWLPGSPLGSATPAAFLLALLLLVVAGDLARPIATGRMVGAGVIGGLLAITRPEGVVLALVVLLGWIALAGESRAPASRKLVLAGTAVAGVLLVFGPWMLRQHADFSSVWPTTDTGLVAVGANAPPAYGGSFIGSFDPASAREAALRASKGVIGEGAVDRVLRERAVHEALAHPAGLAVAAPVRVLRAFELWSPWNERAVHESRGRTMGGWALHWASFILLLALACVGLHRLRHRWRYFAPLYLAPGAAACVALATYGEPLVRTVIDPALAIAVGGVVARMWSAASDRRVRRRANRVQARVNQ